MDLLVLAIALLAQEYRIDCCPDLAIDLTVTIGRTSVDLYMTRLRILWTIRYGSASNDVGDMKREELLFAL